MSWRFLAQRLDGFGGGELFDVDVPLSNSSITKTLSGPDRLTGTVTPEFARLVGPDNLPLLQGWSTAIYAEHEGAIRAGGILTAPSGTDSSLEIDCMGFLGYPQGMPYTESWFGVEIDPVDVVKEIWRHLQSQLHGNIGVVVEAPATGLKIGVELEQGEFDTQSGPLSYESGPVQLNWYSTSDVGGEIDRLAESTPFEYRERHFWQGETIQHRMEIGYPRLGRRREDLRFVVGENITVPPTISFDGDGFANEVLLLGAGEGRAMRRGDSRTMSDPRIRRVKVVTDKAANTAAKASSVARRELALAQGLTDITSVTVVDSPTTPIDSWGLGDDILIQNSIGWNKTETWCRVLSSTISPDAGNTATLTVAKSEMVM